MNEPKPSPANRWSGRRVLGVVLAICCLGVGVKCWRDGVNLKRRFAEWQVARPADVVIDLSTTGQVTFPFHQTCHTAHGEVIGLRLPETVFQHTSIIQLLGNLEAEIRIVPNGGGNAVATAAIEPDIEYQIVDGMFPVINLPSFHIGEYEATLNVIAGAPALKDVPQRLEARYQLCGLESLPGQIASLVGMALSFIGGSILALVLYRVARIPSRPSVTATASVSA